MSETTGWLCMHDSATLPFWASTKANLQTHINSLPAVNHYAASTTKVVGALS